MNLKTLITFGLFLFISTNLIAQNDFDTEWANGFKISSQDGQVKIKLGGRIMYDFVSYFQDDAMKDAFGEYKTGVEFRRIRFFSAGTLYSNVGYKLQMDFSGLAVTVKDVYIELKKIPMLGNIRMGNFKEPFRLEVLTSSKYISFMERSLPTALSQARNTGIMMRNQTKDGRLNWQLAYFRNGNKAGNDKIANGYVVGGRIAGVIPIAKNEEGKFKSFVHLGSSINRRRTKGGLKIYTSRAETHLGPRYIKTALLTNVDHVLEYGLETAFVSGPLSIQGEYAPAQLTMLEDGTSNEVSMTIPTYYVMASFFLTGESRPYVFKNAISGFGRVKPKKDYGTEGGYGAWELLMRYSSADYTEIDKGGKLRDFTLGVNWYLNSATRIMANYVYADLANIGKTGIFQTRIQVDF